MNATRTSAFLCLLSILFVSGAPPAAAFIDADAFSKALDGLQGEYGTESGGLDDLLSELEQAAGEGKDQFLSFTHPAKGAVTFWDVPKTVWFYAPTLALVELEIVSGKEDKQGNIIGYDPSGFVSIGAAMKMSLLAAGVDTAGCSGSTPHTGHWGAQYDICARQYGFGYEGSLDKPATRAEMARFILKAFEVTPTAGQSPFADVPATHPDKDAIAYAYASGIVTGDKENGVETGTFRPESQLNRAEGAAMIQRALESL